MHVVHVLSSFGVGGQERIALDLARAQRAAGLRVSAVSLAAADAGEGALAPDFRAADVDVAFVPKGPGVDLLLVARLAAWLRRAGADVVHTHNPHALIYGGPAGKLAGAAVVHTKHGANPDRGRRLWLRRATALSADAFIAVSDVTAEVARADREVARRKLTVIPNGIDLGRFAPDPAARAEVRAELGIPDDAWVIGTVGRLVPEKDQAVLVRATLPMDGARVLIVGDGPLRGDLERLAAPSAGRIRLLGMRRDTPRLLAAMDVFALTSATEGLPLVLPEAMAAGLPVVATAVGGVPQVVASGETGYLVPPGDVNGVRERLTQLSSNVGLARRMGDEGRRRALLRFSAQSMNDAYLAIYRQVRRKTHL